MTDADIQAKFLHLAGRACAAEAARKLLQTLKSFEDLDNVGTVMRQRPDSAMRLTAASRGAAESTQAAKSTAVRAR